MKPRIFKTLSLALVLFSTTILFGFFGHSAKAAANFVAGRIIDDVVFFAPNSMSAGQIQAFLNSKVPTCDTNGSQPSEFGGGTRAQYGTSRGNPPPYICLKDYSQSVPAVAGDSFCGGSITAGTKTAAQIIYEVGSACGINPQALIVLLQKEQALVTDDWPWPVQYRSATGYGCPDTAACDSQYYGFFNQVYQAAHQYQRYAKQPDFFSYQANGTFFIKYNPDANCGGSNVFLQNQATAGLYNYTPYQPNQAALDSGYGSAPPCGSYGNRNFWKYFTDWFGSTTAVNGSIQLAQGLQLSKSSSAYVNDNITASFQVKNTASFDIDAGGLGVCARMNGQYYDFGFIDHVTVPANGTKSLSFSKRLDSTGNLSIFICSYNSALGWDSDRYPYDMTGSMARQASLSVSDNPLMVSGLIIGPANFSINQAVTAYLSIKNLSSSDINIGSLGVAARDPNGNNVDFPLKNDVVIPAGSQSDLTWTRNFTVPGNYTFWVMHWNGVWDRSYPHSASESIIRQLSWPVLENPLITTGVTLSPSNPAKGQAVTATITIRNVSSSPINIGSLVAAGRDPSGSNVDFPLENDFTIPAGGTKTYSEQRVFNSSGSYKFYIAHWNGVWDTNYPKSIDTSVIRQLTLGIN